MMHQNICGWVMQNLDGTRAWLSASIVLVAANILYISRRRQERYLYLVKQQGRLLAESWDEPAEVLHENPKSCGSVSQCV
jgi:hypothetical protein